MPSSCAKEKIQRSSHPLPDFVREALTRHKVFEAYLARPAYQRNDYIGWINRAAREGTKKKRLAQMVDELAPYKHAKGSVQFPMDHPLPLDLVRRITRFRVKEINGNKA